VAKFRKDLILRAEIFAKFPWNIDEIFGPATLAKYWYFTTPTLTASNRPLTFSIKITQSVKDHTLFTALRQCWTKTTSCYNNCHIWYMTFILFPLAGWTSWCQLLIMLIQKNLSAPVFYLHLVSICRGGGSRLWTASGRLAVNKYKSVQ